MTALPDEPRTWGRLSPDLQASWRRSAGYLANPAAATAPIDLGENDLAAYLEEHPLRLVLPVFRRLLIEPAADAGLITAIGDAQGRLLWVDGARPTLRRAEGSAFQPGANWSEDAIGTSAPGLALATRRGAQVHQEEHFASSAHHFSCSAAPIHDPHTGNLLGMVDLTGGPEAVATHSLPLICAAISAAEAELKVLPARSSNPQLTVLGTAPPQLISAGRRVRLTLRQAELLMLLAWEAYTGGPETGLNAGELAAQLYGETGHEVTLRAEILRLRRVLDSTPVEGLQVLSRPYRLTPAPEVDAVRCARALTAGDRSAALDLYGGHVLPPSEAPGVLRIRHQLSVLLRESVLSDGSGQELWRYLQLPETAGDEDAVYTALRTLPADSPQRAALVARMQR